MALNLLRRPRYVWRAGEREIVLGERTLVMGVLNCTPDSFSDGGRHDSVETAVRHGLAMLDEGADLLDLGAESTRPGATPVSPELEKERLLPVLAALRRARPEALLGVDTYHSATAAAALAGGVDVVNDVSGLLWDEAMARALGAAEPQPGVVLMHARGTPASWATLPALEPGRETQLVIAGLAEQLGVAVEAGIAQNRLLLDPGFGFGKRGEENIALLARLAELHRLDRPLLVGISRKGFLRDAGGRPRPDTGPASEERLYATVAANTAAVLAGAHMLRVHDVMAGCQAAALGDRLLRAAEGTNCSDGAGGMLPP